jgi:hypothetical protein
MSRLKFALWGLLLVTQGVLAEQTFQLGDIATATLSGFVKGELYRATNQSTGLVNCGYTSDPRGVFGTNCQPGPATTLSPQPLNMEQITGDLSHEFDSAWKIDARLAYRWRNGQADIVGQQIIEQNLGVSYPKLGELRGGTMLTRSWSRSDSFSYPLGMSSPWSETGAGYGMVRKALRYSTPILEFEGGRKLTIEGTYASDDPVFAQNAPYVSYDEVPPKPELWEIFMQYSDPSNLVEYVFQKSTGGQQSSFAKGPFLGDVGNADNLGAPGIPGAYTRPTENVNILQGNHYFNTTWVATLGVRRNYWSGVAYQCDYAPLAAGGSGCYFPSGFSNASDNMGHDAWSFDFMGGIKNIDGLWTYGVGFVRLNKAYTTTPTEYGQSNAATFVNIQVNRKVPELYKNLELYTGVGQVRFDNYGPAPLSMPNELADFGVDPRNQRFGTLFTLGATLTF